MPIYDYKCFDCGASFEKLTSFSSADTGRFCSSCNSVNVKRQVPVIAAVARSGASSPEPAGGAMPDFSANGGSCCGGSCGCG